MKQPFSYCYLLVYLFEYARNACHNQQLINYFAYAFYYQNLPENNLDIGN